MEVAADARAAFAQQLSLGQAGIHLARAALLLAAEDDAMGARMSSWIAGSCHALLECQYLQEWCGCVYWWHRG